VPAWILDEDDALELLAFLVTAARTQVDEAAEYGPMRLLAAAHRLGGALGDKASPDTAAAVSAALEQMPPLAVPRGDRDGRAAYVARLDDLCRAVAAHLVAHFGVPADDPA
jgi:Family of unknown function (DUF6092)